MDSSEILRWLQLRLSSYILIFKNQLKGQKLQCQPRFFRNTIEFVTLIKHIIHAYASHEGFNLNLVHGT